MTTYLTTHICPAFYRANTLSCFTIFIKLVIFTHESSSLLRICCMFHLSVNLSIIQVQFLQINDLLISLKNSYGLSTMLIVFLLCVFSVCLMYINQVVIFHLCSRWNQWGETKIIKQHYVVYWISYINKDFNLLTNQIEYLFLLVYSHIMFHLLASRSFVIPLIHTRNRSLYPHPRGKQSIAWWGNSQDLLLWELFPSD